MRHFDKLYVWSALGILIVLPLLYLDYSPKEHPELNQAIRVVRYMSAERQLLRSGFWSTYPEGSPEQFVDWMFSPMGSAVWPPAEGSGEFSQEEQKMIKRTGIPFLPAGVSVESNSVNEDKGLQIVVRGDGERQMLIIEGYLDPLDDPVLIKEWELPLK